MASLQDQLMKAGLVDAKKAKQVNKDKRKQQKVQKKSKTETENEAQVAAAKARAEKQARDRQLNQQRQAEAESKAVVAQIKQLIQTNKIAKGSGDNLLGYNFADGKHIKKIYVDNKIQGQLERGQLAIVSFGDDYELVPSMVADKISERDAQWVISRQETKAEHDEEDPYADYQIPDDLMW